MKFLRNRYFILGLIASVLALVLVTRYIQLQLVDGSSYREISENRLVKNVPLKAPRGEILDRYGRPLVTNRFGYTVSIQKTNIKSKDFNDIISRLITISEKEGISYNDSLPISSSTPFNYTFSNSLSEEEKNSRISYFINKFPCLEEGDSAETAYTKLKEYFDVDEGYTEDTARKIVGVRYEMVNRSFSSNNSFTFATDVNINMITQIIEQQSAFPGVNVYTEPIREYPYPGLATHVLGRVGLISGDEYETLKSEGYNMTATLGKQGIEQAAEKYLRGKDGLSSVKRNIHGSNMTVVEDINPVPGDSVVLTLDSNLQKVAENSLAETINSIANNGIGDYSGKGGDANSGAVIVIDVNTGGILACASYPTYDISQFNKLYTTLSEDKNKPLYNRAINGTYSPGSTFKMLTAVAALQEGVITTQETIEDKGVYEFFDYKPECWLWSDSRRTHGMVNTSKALEVSCNYYFYELGKRLGIENLKKYGEFFGLGEYTGIELSKEESKGVFVTPEYITSTGGIWYPGNTLQVAIGESFNQFTPLQIANYLATIVNGGTRYNAHFIKNVTSSVTGETVFETPVEIKNNVEINPENYEAVMEGMRKVTEDGTASNIFNSYPISVGGKTGTATASRGTANGVFVAFAPFEKPEIAVAIVVEHGAHGNYVAPIARDIFNEYFSLNAKVEEPKDSYSSNILLP